MPIWLSIIFSLPQMLKFVKDMIDLWRSIKTLPKEHQPAATAEFKQVIAACKGAACDLHRQTLLDKFRAKLDWNLAS